MISLRKVAVPLFVAVATLCVSTFGDEFANDSRVVLQTMDYLRNAGFDVVALTNDYSVHADRGWMIASSLRPTARDAAITIFVSRSGLVESYFSRYPGWSYAVGHSVESNDVIGIASSVLHRLGLDPVGTSSNITGAVRLVFFPKAHALAKPVLFFYATEDFAVIERRRQGGASDTSYAW